MEQITLRLSEELKDELEAEYENKGYESRSEYIRDILRDRDRADKLQQEIDVLQSRLNEQERRERERDGLQDQVEELALELRAEKNRAPWPIGWVNDLRGYLGDREED